MRNQWLYSSLALALCAVAAPAQAAASFDTFVGYADNLRNSPYFPLGLCTGTYWNGAAAGASGTCGGQSLDSGAIDVVNTGTTTLSITGLQVTNKPNSGPVAYNIWGVLAISLAPGQNAVFTQTGEYNFDSSDNPFLNNGNDPYNNCSVGADAATPACISNAPLVALTVDGSPVTLSDTGHVLDTGGYDSVYSTPCIGGSNANNPAGSCNESLQWRLIGTTGVQDPGGTSQVPEPAPIALLGLGMAGLALLRRHRRA